MATVIVPPQAELSSTVARRIFCELDHDVTAYRALACEYDADDDTCTWSCELKIGEYWYPTTMPDHWTDGAEIHWS